MNSLCIKVLPFFGVYAENLHSKMSCLSELCGLKAFWRTSVSKHFCLLSITANWLLVLFSKLEKCKVFSLSGVCLESQKSSRKSGGEEMTVCYLPLIIKRRMAVGSQLSIVLRVILWLSFEQVLRGE